MDRMMLRSCRTRLCFRLCMSAVGAAVGSAVKNTAVPGTRCGGLASSLRNSQSRSASFLRVCLASRRDPRTHVTMMRPMQAASSSGTQPPSNTLRKFAVKNTCSRNSSGIIDQRRLPQRPPPVAPHDEEGEQRVDDHRGGDRHAVGGSEVRRRAEGEDDEQHADEQHPVDARQVDLAGHRSPTCA